ncbi:Palmitoyltransferase [Venustampulla echinocandica]|uniref:Palmitoyltransferase n=1 Tax=Venustampulla echinocandica TaxID=2656787 RepID=A0A370TK89_9HELO|nr:Palmitoyltransferase [Venustampulla echinocandica]RDL35940.1 Palmitoyltransferase [Venustampulla echinocandica]
MDSFPNPHVAQSDAGDVASILSSRMTDIASDDGGEYEHATIDPGRVITQSPRNQRRSIQTATGEGASRPDTALTGVSSQRGAWPHSPPSRRGYPAGNTLQRGGTMGSISGSTGTRPPSSSRTHVPSLTSHAFFHPMSSQRLQAQRGPRPPTVHQNEDGSAEGGSSVGRHSVNSNKTLRQAHHSQEGRYGPVPPSPGTEMTEQDTAGRITANTSPTYGFHTTGSLSDSVRPLQSNPANTKGLSVNIDKSYKNGTTVPTPSKSPRSFRSSFLLPSRGDVAPNSPNRSTHGREKLSSVASSPGLTPVDPPKAPPKLKSGKNYEYFTGNMVFCWGGRLQNTRDKPINIATGLFVVLPGVLFFVFSASWLWHNISPAIPILCAYIFYICLSSFIHASVSDPGILPRNLQPMPPLDENEDPLTLGPPLNDWVLIKSAQSSAAAMEVPAKYCKTCNIWRPPRGHHCRVCDNCVETQDHHCVWLNNCVGRRNYRYFFTFVSSSTLLGLYIIGASLTQIITYKNQNHISFNESISHFRVPFAMVIYGILATPYPAALMGYHLFLMGRGETTREYLNSHKFLKKDRHRPFTQANVFRNWIAVLCRPRPPTYLNFKRKYEDGDQRFGERKDKRTAPLKTEYQGGVGVGVDMELRDVATGSQGPATTRKPPSPRV